MPSKMGTKDTNNNPLGKIDGIIDSGALGDEGHQCGDECDLPNLSKDAEEAEFEMYLAVISRSNITVGEERSHLIALIKKKPQPKVLIKRLVLTMAEVGIGKSKIFKSILALYRQKEKIKAKDQVELGEGKKEEPVRPVEVHQEKETAIYPLDYGAFSSHGPTYDSRFATLTKSDTELVFSTHGDRTHHTGGEGITSSCQNGQDAIFADRDPGRLGKTECKRVSSLEEEVNTQKKAKAEYGVRFLAERAENDEAIMKTWREVMM